MSVKKLLVLLLVPLALIALIPILAPGMFSGENEASGDALAGTLGNLYGIYFGALLVFFIIGRIRQRAK